jgi:intracellular sulfur oxidation DsrE/DsrF family protein
VIAVKWILTTIILLTAIPAADGYVDIPGAAVAPDRAQTYRAIFDATQAAVQPTHAGVELFVCGQNLAADNIDPKTLSPEVRIAADALIVLMTYQSKGYALLSF